MIELRLRHASGELDLDLQFRSEARTLALFGHSGAGKTSVLNAVAGLLEPQSGRIVLDGEVLLDTDAGVRVPVARRRLGYVFQDGRLFPHLSVRHNLLYGAPPRDARTAPSSPRWSTCSNSARCWNAGRTIFPAASASASRSAAPCSPSRARCCSTSR